MSGAWDGITGVCLSYLCIAMTKHQDQGKLEKQALNGGLPVSEGESMTVMVQIMGAGRHGAAATVKSFLES